MPNWKSAFLALALVAAAPAAMAFTDCMARGSHGCSHPGAPCGTKKDPGRCQTIQRPGGWPRHEMCVCHPSRPSH